MNQKLLSLFNIVIIAPLFILIGMGKFPHDYKKWLILLGIIIIIFNLWRLYMLVKNGNVEGMYVTGTTIGEVGIVDDRNEPDNANIGCGVPPDTTYGGSEVEVINGLNVYHIRMFDSSPGYETPLIRIKQGDVIVWSNVGEVMHTVTEKDFLFNSGYMKPGGRFSVRFTEKGEFDYYSIPDEGWMVGKVIVS